MLAPLFWSSPALAEQQSLHPPTIKQDFVVEWYQPHGLAADGDWEVEVTPFWSGVTPTVERAEAVATDSCWALEVPTSGAALVRIRQAGSQAEWSGYSAVPEPSSSSAIGAGLLLAAGLGARRRRKASGRRACHASGTSTRHAAAAHPASPEEEV